MLSFEKVDLINSRMQYRPEVAIHNIMKNDEGCVDFNMLNSPHYELSELYLKHGLKWLNKKFDTTRYYQLLQFIGGAKRLSPIKVKLFKSLKTNGYLGGPHKKSYIVLLEELLIKSRYGINISASCPEVFLGHHRVGFLLAMGVNKVDVIIAKDIRKGSKQFYGELHSIYSRVKNVE